MTVQASIAPDGRAIWLEWPDGVIQELGARWLFDHAEGTRDPVSGQRLEGALELADASQIGEARIEGDLLETRFAPSGVRRRISVASLRSGPTDERTLLWPTPDPIRQLASVPFDDFLADDDALRETLWRVARFGLALLSRAREEPGEVERAVARFGFVRETNYGRVFDVKIEPSPSNLAFSDRGLELHTDNPYRDPVPTLQLLHAIVADPGGGETSFVDGFAQAEALKVADPVAFALLSQTLARFRYADASGACWTAAAPIIELDAGGSVRTIRLNHRALDLPPGDAGASERWYEAYLAFHRQAHSPGAAFERALRPGEMVIFDNRRILHGRRGLTGDSPRWLQGCYADRDGLEATLARLQASNLGRTR